MIYKVDHHPQNAREGDIPYYAKWSDGSEYDVKRLPSGAIKFRYHGPFFGREIGDWYEGVETR